MRGGLVSASGFNLAIRSDALFVTTSSEEISGMPASEADASRLRLALEGFRPFASASGSSLAPSIELGLTVELRAHRLMAHEENSYSQWGAGGWVHLAPRGPAKGFSARLGSSVGATASGAGGWGRRVGRGPHRCRGGLRSGSIRRERCSHPLRWVFLFWGRGRNISGWLAD